MRVLFVSYVNTCTLQNKLTWGKKNYQHIMEFLINVHNLKKKKNVLKVPL